MRNIEHRLHRLANTSNSEHREAGGNVQRPTLNVERSEGEGQMDALGCDSPLTPALSPKLDLPMGGEGGECVGVSTSPELVLGSAQVGKGSTESRPTEDGVEPIIKFRAAQREFLRGVEQHRLVAFVARRQFGKTTTFAALALKKMMKRANHTVVFGSAKLNLAREIVRKEAEVIQRAIAALAKQAEKAEGLLQVVDGKTGRALGGVPVYDLERGEPLSPDEHRARSLDKDAWDRNYAVKFVFGGTAACGLLQLESAQARGIGSCACLVIEDEADMTIAMAFLRDHLTNNPVGIGLDLATTEKESSNPTALTVMEASGVELTGRLTLVWKTRDPAVSKERVRRVVKTINERSRGGPARRLCIDATNERYFAIELSRDIAGEVPVELIVGSESAPGINEEAMVMKAYLGNLLIGELEDNHLTLAPERYLKEDFRLVKRDRGSFSTDTAADGKHGDTFDAHKLALWALRGGAAGAVMSVEGIRMAANVDANVFRPRRLRLAA